MGRVAPAGSWANVSGAGTSWLPLIGSEPIRGGERDVVSSYKDALRRASPPPPPPSS